MFAACTWWHTPLLIYRQRHAKKVAPRFLSWLANTCSAKSQSQRTVVEHLVSNDRLIPQDVILPGWWWCVVCVFVCAGCLLGGIEGGGSTKSC